MEKIIYNAYIITPDVPRGAEPQKGYVIFDRKIKKVKSGEPSPSEKRGTRVIDAEENFLLPAFLNPHDHLIGTWYPRIGDERPYRHWYQWEVILKKHPVYSERGKIPKEILYRLADYKTIFGGATTVADHVPHELNRDLLHQMYVRVVVPYALAHSVYRKFRLLWGKGIAIEHLKAELLDIPFFIHIEEGFTYEIQTELPELIKEGGLGPRTLMIHCIGFDDFDRKKVKESGASVVWCPYSNWFMYGRTAEIPEFLKAGINVTLGTDSCMSGSDHLLHEINFAYDLARKLWGGIDPVQLYLMITENSAKALRQKLLGKLSAGYLADLLILRRSKENPFENLVQATPKDILFLSREGKSLLAKSDMWANEEEATEVRVEGEKRVLVGNIEKMKEEIDAILGYDKELPFIPVDF